MSVKKMKNIEVGKINSARITGSFSQYIGVIVDYAMGEKNMRLLGAKFVVRGEAKGCNRLR